MAAFLALTAPQVRMDGGAWPVFPLETLWTAALERPVASGPIAGGRNVYAVLRDGPLVALDVETGRVRWTVARSTRVAPAASDQRVFLAVPPGLEAFDAASGTSTWQIDLGAEASAPPLSRAGWVVLPLANGEVVAVRGEDGTVLWHLTLPSPVTARPALNGESLFLSLADGTLLALDLRSGTQIWYRRFPEAMNQPLALAGRVYVGGQDNFFYCLDERDGRVLWRWRTGADIVGAASLDENHVYFVSLDNVLRGVERFNGNQRWTRPLTARPSAGPLLAGGTLIVAGLAPELIGLRATDGRPDGRHPVPAELLTAPPLLVEREPPARPLLIVTAGTRLFALQHRIGLPVQPLTETPGVEILLTPPPGVVPPPPV